MAKVYFQGNRDMARASIISIVRSLTGHEDTHLDAAYAVHTSIGLAALSDIKDDFVRKAAGSVGEDGNKWPPLSPEYLAYGRRFGRGEQAKLKKGAGLGPGHRHRRSLLSKSQDKRWAQIFASRLARLAASMPLVAAKARAAQIAWATLKREGAKTKLMVFGSRKVDILRDTGILLNSLSPGKLDSFDGQYYGAADQIFDLTRSGVIVGTNVPYAGVHQHGSKKKTGKGGGIPARPFLPIDRVPTVWADRWRRVATLAINRMIKSVMGTA